MGVFIVEDLDAVRFDARSLIEREDDLYVCGESISFSEAMEMIEMVEPDVVIVDITYPDGDGFQLIYEIKKNYPEIQILVLTMLSEEIYAEQVFHAGASGFVMKHEATEKLVGAIRKVLK
ncbi:MAG: response regulator transcription factor [Candidatus Theseobacter exili]|nr:response regulator transcription factor [Candidatus Theseobacter exili]